MGVAFNKGPTTRTDLAVARQWWLAFAGEAA
jgi:hypothetical protein